MAEADFQVTGHATVLHVKDMPTALAFYRDKLGFIVSFSWEDPPRYVCLRLDEASIHLNSYVPPAWALARLHLLQRHRRALRPAHGARRRHHRTDRRPGLRHARFRDHRP